MKHQENRNLDIIRQVVEKGFSEEDMDVIDRLVHANVVEHQFGRPSGIDALKRSIHQLAAGFSERKYVLEHAHVDGDTAWVHYLFTGVHTGEFFGCKPAGTIVTIHVMDIVKISEGKIAEHWGIPDRFALLTQIGFIKLP